MTVKTGYHQVLAYCLIFAFVAPIAFAEKTVSVRREAEAITLTPALNFPEIARDQRRVSIDAGPYYRDPGSWDGGGGSAWGNCEANQICSIWDGCSEKRYGTCQPNNAADPPCRGCNP